VRTRCQRNPQQSGPQYARTQTVIPLLHYLRRSPPRHIEKSSCSYTLFLDAIRRRRECSRRQPHGQHCLPVQCCVLFFTLRRNLKITGTSPDKATSAFNRESVTVGWPQKSNSLGHFDGWLPTAGHANTPVGAWGDQNHTRRRDHEQREDNKMQ
jgi:hypothetical protein